MIQSVKMPDHIREMALSGWESYVPLSDALEEMGLLHWAEHIREHWNNPSGGRICQYITEDGDFEIVFTEECRTELEEYAKKTGQM